MSDTGGYEPHEWLLIEIDAAFGREDTYSITDLPQMVRDLRAERDSLRDTLNGDLPTYCPSDADGVIPDPCTACGATIESGVCRSIMGRRT